jgi:hypothetical protein
MTCHLSQADGAQVGQAMLPYVVPHRVGQVNRINLFKYENLLRSTKSLGSILIEKLLVANPP